MQTIEPVLPILLLVVCVTGLAVALLVLGRLLNPRRPTAVKQMPYESGMDPVHDTRRRFDVQFHLLAIAFLVFDVELLFLYPWAVVAAPARAVAVQEGVGDLGKEGIRNWGLGIGDWNDIQAHRLRPVGSAGRVISPSHRLQPAGLTVPTIHNPNPESRVPNPESRIPNPESRIPHPLVFNRRVVFDGVMVFIALLGLGFVYDWRKGVFAWR